MLTSLESRHLKLLHRKKGKPEYFCRRTEIAFKKLNVIAKCLSF